MVNQYLETTYYAVSNACTITTLKCISVILYIVTKIAFGDVDGAILIGVGMLTIMDFITAIMREYKLKHPIQSRKIVKTAVKLFVYGIMISSSYITEVVIGIKAFNVPITEIMAIFIAVTELVSILENVGDMGYVVPKKLLGRLKDFRDTK